MADEDSTDLWRLGVKRPDDASAQNAGLAGQRVLVTGGAGLIGSHLVEHLLETDVAEVIVFDNFSRGTRTNLSRALRDPRCKVFPDGGDVLQTDILDRAMSGADAVCHLAAVWLLQCREYPQTAFDVNVRGTFNVIESALKHSVRRFVFSSSASVYGDALTLPIREEHPYNNLTFYGATKIAGEHFLKSLATSTSMAWVGLRYMNVYGPRQDYRGAYVAVMHRMLDCIERGLPLVVVGEGNQRYDFIEVSDIARANVLALTSAKSGQFYNIGTGVGTSLNALAALLLRLTGATLPITHAPAVEGLVSSRVGSTEAATRDLSFQAQISLEEGLRGLIAWRRADRGTVPLQAAGADADRRHRRAGLAREAT